MSRVVPYIRIPWPQSQKYGEKMKKSYVIVPYAGIGAYDILVPEKHFKPTKQP